VKALVTGFEPFGGERLNASREAVSRLHSRIGALAIATATLPTSYARSHVALDAAMAREDPDVVLCVGEAGDRGMLCVERIAVNLQDARIPDNDGAQPDDVPVVAGGPAACFATLPVKAAVRALQAAGLAAAASTGAGTFVCNHVFYRLLHRAPGGKRVMAGFLHVPRLPEQAAGPGGAAPMPAQDIAHGIEIVLATAAAELANR